MSGYVLSLDDEKTFQSQGLCSPDVFYDLVCGLMHRFWSGVASLEVHGFQKKIIFCNGKPVFARSNLIDDRLGEVIYRRGMIHIDQLLQSTTQVTREQRFGQVLLSSRIFDQKTLWLALQEQIKSIYTSIFMAESIRYELLPLDSYEFHLGFEHSEDIMAQCYGYGLIFRDFLNKVDIPSNPAIALTSEGESLLSKERGSYLADMLSLVQSTQFINAFLDSSKLHHSHTMAGLMDLYKKGYATFGSHTEFHLDFGSKFSDLSVLIELYNQLAKKIQAVYKQTQGTFPLEAMRKMTFELNENRVFGLCLDEQGLLLPSSLEDILLMIQGGVFPEERFVQKFCHLIRYLMQLAGDSLPRRLLEPVHQEYKKTFEKIRKTHHRYTCS